MCLGVIGRTTASAIILFHYIRGDTSKGHYTAILNCKDQDGCLFLDDCCKPAILWATQQEILERCESLGARPLFVVYCAEIGTPVLHIKPQQVLMGSASGGSPSSQLPGYYLISYDPSYCPNQFFSIHILLQLTKPCHHHKLRHHSQPLRSRRTRKSTTTRQGRLLTDLRRTVLLSSI